MGIACLRQATPGRKRCNLGWCSAAFCVCLRSDPTVSIGERTHWWEATVWVGYPGASAYRSQKPWRRFGVVRAGSVAIGCALAIGVMSQAVAQTDDQTPSGMVAFFMFSGTTCPAGWTAPPAAQGRLILGVTDPARVGSAVGTPMARSDAAGPQPLVPGRRSRFSERDLTAGSRLLATGTAPCIRPTTCPRNRQAPPPPIRRICRSSSSLPAARTDHGRDTAGAIRTRHRERGAPCAGEIRSARGVPRVSPCCCWPVCRPSRRPVTRIRRARSPSSISRPVPTAGRRRWARTNQPLNGYFVVPFAQPVPPGTLGLRSTSRSRPARTGRTPTRSASQISLDDFMYTAALLRRLYTAAGMVGRPELHRHDRHASAGLPYVRISSARRRRSHPTIIRRPASRSISRRSFWRRHARSAGSRR